MCALFFCASEIVSTMKKAPFGAFLLSESVVGGALASKPGHPTRSAACTISATTQPIPIAQTSERSACLSAM